MRRAALIAALVCMLSTALVTRAPAGSFAVRFEEIKRTATPAQLYTFLYALPKGGDLHNHLGGAGLSEWWYALATDPARNGGDTYFTRVAFTAPASTASHLVLFQTLRRHAYDRLPAAEQADYRRLDALDPAQKQAWLDSVRLETSGEGRTEFFDATWPRLGQLFSSLEVMTGILEENIRAFGAEGLRYLETQFGALNYVTNNGDPIPVDEAVAFIERRLARPEVVSAGVTVRFQEMVLRFAPGAEQQLARRYVFVDAHRDRWVGLNMAGIEENGKGYPLRFLEKYRELRRRYPAVRLSIHAGEMDGPDHHVRDTLLLGASRIGHGLNLIQDPDTLLLLQQSQRVLVEINLISNRLLEYTPDLGTHPFPEYLRTGVPVCLNTDDRGMWDSNLTDEYYTAVTMYRLSWDEVVQLGRNSLAYSFLQPEAKAALLSDYEKAIQAFEDRFSEGELAPSLRNVKPVSYGYAKRTWGLEFPGR